VGGGGLFGSDREPDAIIIDLTGFKNLSGLDLAKSVKCQIEGNEMTEIKKNGFPLQSIARKAGRFMLVGIAVVLSCVLILAGILQLWSMPGKPQPFLDAGGNPLAGSIAEKVFIEVNGVREGMFIKGKSVNNPVLLYLHGGIPDYFLTQQYPTGWEEHFTVAWWEMRGSGISYSPSVPRETMTLDQMVADTLEVTNYLRNRFGKEKIYLMGHSGGTFIAIQAAARAPELYYAYIGVAQMSNQLKSEKLAYDYMLEQFKKEGNTSMVRKLEAAPVTLDGGIPQAYLMLRDPGMHPLGIGTMHGMKSIVTGLFLPSLEFREYTLGDKINLWRGKVMAGVSILWKDNLATDLSKTLPALDLPVYFLHGVYDYTCSYTEAKAYFEVLKAPVKGFYTFEHSAHSPMFEEPGKTLKILLEDVLAGTNNLADLK
jgi:pimeloyl-ACP methyl ester carboxylesterase